MSTTKTELRLTLTYNNYAERTYAYTVADSIMSSADDIAYVKTKINEFNQAAVDTTSNVYKTFVSDSGSHIKEITGAEIRYVESDVIYNG